LNYTRRSISPVAQVYNRASQPASLMNQDQLFRYTSSSKLGIQVGLNTTRPVTTSPLTNASGNIISGSIER